MRSNRPSNRVSCSRYLCHQREAFALIQLLSVLFIVAVGSTLMATSIASILRTKKHADALTDRYAVLTDFTHCLRRDVRGSSAMRLRSEQDNGVPILTLEGGGGLVSYTFLPESVERVGFDGDPMSNKAWSFVRTQVLADLEAQTGSADPILHVTVLWRSLAHDDAQPQRRFDLAFRSVGEVYDEQH